MTTSLAERADQVYAGVLGKIIGVYLGRPVEGWAYDDISARFGTVEHYVHRALGRPLVVPDDDISGTFVFARAQADAGGTLDSDAVADAWLNYVVEGRTVLWWGGLSRSTEHTVFLRLKDGVRPPLSGSIALNGRAMAEQVGAQIFVDTWGLLNPGEPDRAVAAARAAAQVSHGGLAVDAAALVAGMEALAFDETDLDTLLDTGLALVGSAPLSRLVDEVRALHREHADWRDARTAIEQRHGYDRYPSNSPVQTNHAAVVMALLYGGDDFQRSISICTSAGWDTDSNTGNVGCLNGVRLGLRGIDAGADLRGPVADELWAISADGGEAVSDAVRETRKLLLSAAQARGCAVPLPEERFAFERPGSVQGWRLDTGGPTMPAAADLSNPAGGALAIAYRGVAPGATVRLDVRTGPDPAPHDTSGTSEFAALASPTLYPGQSVEVSWQPTSGPLLVRPYVRCADDRARESTVQGPAVPVTAGGLSWVVPDLGGRPVHRFGLELLSTRRTDGTLVLDHVDWTGAPRHFRLGRATAMSPELTPWTTDTVWLRSFVSSAENLAPDHTTTFCVSHPRRGGVVTTGTADWDDYALSSRIQFNASEGAGLVARARGHRRYYSAQLSGDVLRLVRVRDGDEHVLASVRVEHEVDEVHDLTLRVVGTHVSADWDGVTLLDADDATYRCGGAGFVVHRGAFLADGLDVRAVTEAS